MKITEKILIVDFGGQYNQLIARRVRDLNVYSDIVPASKALDYIRENKPIGIIFTGGPNSVYEEKAPLPPKEIFDLNIPILGICYGMQAMAHCLGGKVEKSLKREFGKTLTKFDTGLPIFKNIKDKSSVWMSHVDCVSRLPEGFVSAAQTANTKNAAMANKEKKLYGIQFHAEVEHSEEGQNIIKNFLYNVCGAKGDWNMKSFLAEAIKDVQNMVKDGKVLLALSGGVDSSVAAGLLSRAIGKQLYCVFVDHGLLRKNEGDQVEEIFGEKGDFELNFVRVNAGEEYFEKLAGVEDPEKKRKIIGEQFIRIFEREANKIGTVDFLAQGTIYADVVESGLGKGAVIKSHHNVGGLPKNISFKEIVEPLRLLFKDEVRKVGLELGLPEHLVYRQPFPGPGLGVRIIGEVTPEKVRMVQDADFIYREEIEKAGLSRSYSQYFAALTNMRSVGVMGDFRTYDYAVALRAVITDDFMTAECADIPFSVLQRVMNRIVNEVKGVNRVFYDLTSKPPGTIEME